MGHSFKKLGCWVGKLGAFHEATLQSLQRSFSNAARATGGLSSPRHAPRGLRLCFRWLRCWASVRRLEQQKHRGKSPVGEAHSIATAKEIGQCFLLYSTLSQAR